MANDILTPDSFMSSQAPALAPDEFMTAAKGPLTPDSFMQLQSENLPSREAFEASHRKAVAEAMQPKPAAPSSWWDRIKDSAGLVPTVISGLTNKTTEMVNTPLVPESVTSGTPSIKPPAAGDTGPAQLEPWKPKSVAGAVVHGAAEFARGMTSPENIGLAAMMGPVARIAPLLSRAVSGGFGVQMLKGAYDQIPEVREAVESKDWPKAAGAITTAVLSGGLGALAGRHALKGEPVMIQKATESARTGVEALTPDSFMQEQATPNVRYDPVHTPDGLEIHARDASGKIVGVGEFKGNGPELTPHNVTVYEGNRRQGIATGIYDSAKQEWSKRTGGSATIGADTVQTPEGAAFRAAYDAVTPDSFMAQQAPASPREQSTVPETPETIKTQLGQLVAGDRKAVMLPTGTPLPALHPAMRRWDTDAGTFIYDPAKLSPAEIHSALAESRLPEILGAADGGMGAPDKSQIQGEPITVVTRDAEGREVQSIVTDQQNLARTLEQSKKLLPANGTVGIEPAEKVIAERQAASAPTQLTERPQEPSLPPREPSVLPAYGREAAVAVPGERTSYPVRYAVRELADVQASHNPFNFEPNSKYEYTNDRDYSRTGNAARVVQNAAPDTFNPEFPTTESPTAEHGAPIIDASGNVLGGNSRTMTLARVYERGGPDAHMYRDAVKTKAQQFGIDRAELDRFKNPVLVRELGGAVDAQKAITDFNKAAAADLTPEERAVSDGRRLSPETIQDIAGRLGDLGEEGTLAESLRGDDGAAVLNRLVKDGVLTEQEKGGYLDDRGNLTPEAKSRIGKALVGRLFDKPSEFRETTPAVRAKLERIAPQLLRVEGRPEWDLTDTTRSAIALAEDVRTHGMTVEDAARQAVVGGDRSYSPDAVALARTVSQGPVKAAGAFRRYANDEALSREGSQGAFYEPPSRAEAFADAFHIPNVIERVNGATASERGSAPMLMDLAEIGAHYLRRGVEKFSEWSQRMVEAVGDWVRPHLARVFEAARKVLSDERGSFSNKPLDEPGSLFGSEEDQQTARESAADRDKLTGERLTAQFNAPLSREEQLRKLRAGEAPPQTHLFEETPEKQQFSLFGPERGGISPDLLSLGASKFVQEDVIPAAKRVASDLVEAKDDITRIVAPQLRGSAAEMTGLSLRQRMSQFARRFDQGEQRLRDARKFFNTRAPEDNYRFIDNVEHGLGRGTQPGDAELEPMARIFAKMLDQRRQEVQALGEGALKGYYENYFPHIFERPEQASKFVESFFSGRRSMEGPKSFLQHRDFPTFREALDAGLKPVSNNPVDLVMMKAREMDHYLLAHAVLRDLAENGVAKRVSGLGPDARQAEMMGGAPIRPEWAVERREDLPPAFQSIRDPVGGGKWYAEEGAADVLNNYLSPGLRGRSGLFRTLLGVNNVMNQANLGLSAFHLKAEVINSMSSRLGLGVVKALQGHPADAAFHIVTSPIAPFIDYMKGSQALREWFKPGSEGAPIAGMVDALMKGGGRARMDAFYQNDWGTKMQQAFRSGNFIGGAVRSPFAAIEFVSKPLMQHLVPRMKLGVFSDMAQHELARLGPDAKVQDVQRVMSNVWDHVEYRMGQITYDNLFWHRTFKDVAMLTVRSVGWNLGDLLEVKSAVGAIRQLASGKKPADLHGLGFVVGYTVTAAMIGAIAQYLHTGQGPQELKDYFFPKREDGTRMTWAPYVKDAYSFAKDPARTLENKASPLISTVSEMIHNRDYYDRPIRNTDDSFVKQLEQEAQFVGRQMLPFTLQPHAGKNAAPVETNPEHKLENFLGVTKAPAATQPGYKPRKQPARSR